MNDLLITFTSTHLAIRGERTALALGLSCDLIPLPRVISSECGFGLWLDGKAWPPLLEGAASPAGQGYPEAGILERLQRSGLILEAAYRVVNSEKEKTYERIDDQH